VWVVKNASQAEDAWRKVGLEDIHEQGSRITVDGPRRLGAKFVTGRIGHFAVEIIQPDAGDAVYGGFLKRHGDGVFAVLYAAPDRQQMERESARLAKKGALVLRTLDAAGSHYTFFDTEPEGKYVLGLVSRPSAEASAAPSKVTHVGLVVRKAAPVSEYWQRLGFPEISLGNATPRPGRALLWQAPPAAVRCRLAGLFASDFRMDYPALATAQLLCRLFARPRRRRAAHRNTGGQPGQRTEALCESWAGRPCRAGRGAKWASRTPVATPT